MVDPYRIEIDDVYRKIPDMLEDRPIEAALVLLVKMQSEQLRALQKISEQLQEIYMSIPEGK